MEGSLKFKQVASPIVASLPPHFDRLEHMVPYFFCSASSSCLRVSALDDPYVASVRSPPKRVEFFPCPLQGSFDCRFPFGPFSRPLPAFDGRAPLSRGRFLSPRPCWHQKSFVPSLKSNPLGQEDSFRNTHQPSSPPPTVLPDFPTSFSLQFRIKQESDDVFSEQTIRRLFSIVSGDEVLFDGGLGYLRPFFSKPKVPPRLSRQVVERRIGRTRPPSPPPPPPFSYGAGGLSERGVALQYVLILSSEASSSPPFNRKYARTIP